MDNTVKKLSWVGVFAFIGVVLYLLSPMLTPFLIAAFIAYLGDPLVDKLERWGLSRTWSSIIVFFMFALLFFIVVLMLVPMIASQIELFGSAIPRYVEWFQSTALPYLSLQLGGDADSVSVISIKELLSENWQTASGVLKTLLAHLTRSGVAIAGWFASLVLIPVVAFYLLRDWDVLVEHIKDLLPRGQLAKSQLIAVECDGVLSAFLRGQLMIMLSLSLIYAVGLGIVGLDLSILIGLIAGVASVVPYLGSAVGIIAAMIAGAVQFHDVMHLVAIAAVFGVGQLIESMILTPLLVGDKIGLHPVAVIFAVMAGGQLFGFVGILLALPVAAILVVLLRHAHRGYTNSIFYQQASEETHNSSDD